MIVLHILDHSLPIISGYSTRSRSIAVWQRAAGLRPLVLTSSRQGVASTRYELVDGIAHYRTSIAGQGIRWPHLREIRGMLGFARRIAEVARLEQVNILHAHSPVLNGLPALWVARRLGIPIVYEARAFWEDAAVDHGVTREGSLRYRLSRALETVVFRQADGVVTIAEAMRRTIVQRGVDPVRLTVVPNGVDTEHFRPMSPRPELARSLGLEGHLVIGFIGSFYHYEGLRFMLEAFPAIRERLPRCRLLLVGGGEEDSSLRKIARPFGASVVFVDQVSHNAIRDFYSLIDVFVCPRRRMRLTELVTPLKPLEAMAMARPILASDVGGLAELIRNELTGLLFPAESRHAFVAQALRLLSDATLRNRLGEAAREHVKGERAWHRIVSRYAILYESLACNGRVGGSVLRQKCEPSAAKGAERLT